MQKQITFLELVRLIASMVLGMVLHFLIAQLARGLLPTGGGPWVALIYLILEILLPAFLAILIAGMLPSWRYKTIAAHSC